MCYLHELPKQQKACAVRSISLLGEEVAPRKRALVATGRVGMSRAISCQRADTPLHLPRMTLNAVQSPIRGRIAHFIGFLLERP